MAEVSVDHGWSFPLDKACVLGDLQRSNVLYNSLVDDSQQPPVATNIIADLAALFVGHDAHKVLGVHLIHGHFQLPDKTVLMGTTFPDKGIRWAKPVFIASVDPAAVHGHVFVVTENRLCPYELEEGPLPDMSCVKNGFIKKFKAYLRQHNLTKLLGLQVLGCVDESMCELILEQGTVMVETSQSQNVVATRITGWRFESVDGRPRVAESGETHSKMTNGNHKVFNAGKPLPKLENIDDLVVALTDAGVL